MAEVSVDIHINYDDHSYCKVKKLDVLESLLIRDGDRKVVFFGEGDFTFSVAFATLRESWRGITSTCYEKSLEREFSEAQREAIRYCKFNGGLLEEPRPAIDLAVAKVRSLQAPLPNAWLYGIDATNNTLEVKEKVVWFQCPWTGEWNSDDTHNLIVNFLKHMVTKQSQGDYLLIGITTFFPYVKTYKLLNVVESIPGYEFLGADTALVAKLLRYGYHHQGNLEIHEKILQHHVTLVFRRE